MIEIAEQAATGHPCDSRFRIDLHASEQRAGRGACRARRWIYRRGCGHRTSRRATDWSRARTARRFRTSAAPARLHDERGALVHLRVQDSTRRVVTAVRSGRIRLPRRLSPSSCTDAASERDALAIQGDGFEIRSTLDQRTQYGRERTRGGQRGGGGEQGVSRKRRRFVGLMALRVLRWGRRADVFLSGRSMTSQSGRFRAPSPARNNDATPATARRY